MISWIRYLKAGSERRGEVLDTAMPLRIQESLVFRIQMINQRRSNSSHPMMLYIVTPLVFPSHA
jgi:hypothetical protein